MLPPFLLLPLPLPPLPFTLPPAPAAPVLAGGVVVIQPLRSCSFVLVPPFVWAAFVRAHWPSFVLATARLRSFAGPCLSLLVCPRSVVLAGPRARRCSSPFIYWSPFLFGFRSRSFGFVRARLGSFALVWVSFALIQAWL